MRRLAVALVIALATGTSLAAADSRVEAMLKRVDPSDRLEVICDYAAAAASRATRIRITRTAR
jgi:hypothetical protein